MSEFIGHLQEILEPFGPVLARRMFGGYGIYREGIMFGIVVDDTLYLKSDPTTAEDFVAKGLRQFEYQKAGKTVKMSFYLAPEDFLEDPDEAMLWAARAYAAALRARAKKNRKTGMKTKQAGTDY